MRTHRNDLPSARPGAAPAGVDASPWGERRLSGARTAGRPARSNGPDFQRDAVLFNAQPSDVRIVRPTSEGPLD
jgi:hypothetical protein